MWRETGEIDKMLAGLPEISPDRPVLIAGPTASGKSALAMAIARDHGGVIVNADASQVYDCWRIITARPSVIEEAQIPHRLYGHIAWNQDYSAGHWLREVKGFLNRGERPIIVGGTGLYFMALTRGMTDIPAIPAAVRAEADAMDRQSMLAALDSRTKAAIDLNNRARVQRAYEVQHSTGRGLADWQAGTPPPLLPLTGAHPLVFDTPKERLEERIRQRFDLMLEQGALEEVAAMIERYDPALPSCRAIGVPDLAAHLRGDITLDEARERVSIATRQFAKRQRTWFRSKMADWHKVYAQT
jgi:tRNA dimethylallyltransferase